MKTFSKKPSGNEILHYIHCPVCGNPESEKWWDCGDFFFVRCPVCFLIYQNPQPDFSSLAQRYDNEYFRYETQNEEAFFKLMKLGLEDVKFFNYRKIDLPGRILDIGCATGRLLKFFKDQGWQTSGAEICRESAEYGNEHYQVDIFNGPLEKADFPDASMDVIHCSHLIEHLQNPRSFIMDIVRLLKPGGFFICTTPSAAGLQARLFHENWRSAIADHMFLFSPDNLRAMLETEELSVLEYKTWGGLAIGAGPAWLKKILDPLAKKWGFGDVMIMLCRKPL